MGNRPRKWVILRRPVHISAAIAISQRGLTLAKPYRVRVNRLCDSLDGVVAP
jgi:hypothetical protein